MVMMKILLMFVSMTSLVFALQCPTDTTIQDNCNCKIFGSKEATQELVISCKNVKQDVLTKILTRLKNTKIHKFEISKADITDLKNDTFKYFSVRSLIISDSKIQNIGVGAFRGIKGLYSLSLKGLSISKIPRFPQVSSLKYLIISQHQIPSLQEEDFYDLENLNLLEISHGHISDFPEGALFPLIGIFDLNLNDNGIKQIPDVLIGPGSQLKIVDFSNNRLTFVPANAFLYAKKLKIIYLDNNLFKTIAKESFQRLYLLKTQFSLTGNPINCDDSLCWIAANKKGFYFSGQITGQCTYSNLPNSQKKSIAEAVADNTICASKTAA